MNMLCERMDCCGCGACASACKINAIQIISDLNGFLNPKIDAQKCLGCGACTRACPELNKNFKNKGASADCYVGQLTDLAELKCSQSGGAFWALVNYIITMGGVVYGCAYKNHFVAAHIRAETLEECNAMRGSKYVQSDMSGVFTAVKNDLVLGRLVLFSGTPCQCAGLQSFLGRSYDNLVLCDIICHGVASPLLTKKYIEEIENIWHSAVCQFHYRYYDGEKIFWGTHNNKTVLKNGKTIYDRVLPDMYYSHAFFRNSCYRCPFGSKIVSNITIADAWGVQNFCPQLDADINRGVSEVLIWPTVHSAELYGALSERMKLHKVKYEDIAKYQPHLSAPIQASNDTRTAWKRVHRYGVIYSHQIMKWKSLFGSLVRKIIRNK